MENIGKNFSFAPKAQSKQNFISSFGLSIAGRTRERDASASEGSPRRQTIVTKISNCAFSYSLRSEWERLLL